MLRGHIDGDDKGDPGLKAFFLNRAQDILFEKEQKEVDIMSTDQEISLMVASSAHRTLLAPVPFVEEDKDKNGHHSCFRS